MSDIKDYGVLTLGSYLRKVSDLLYKEVDDIYASQGFEHSSRMVPCLLLIKDNGQIPVTVLAEKLGQTHSAVSQMSRKLLSSDLIFDTPDPADERRRLLSLTPKGYEYLDKMDWVLKQIKIKLDEMLGLKGELLIHTLAELETQQSEQSLSSRVVQAISEHREQEIKIIDYSSEYRDSFKSLNIEWLEKYFYVEEIDERVLSEPEDYIIKPGGHIFIALMGDKPVGTAALIKANNSRLELSKMAVTEGMQGKGVGRKLLNRALDYFKKSKFETLFLESNSKLKTALGLYESVGFEHTPKPGGESHYQRADVYMEYRG